VRRKLAVTTHDVKEHDHRTTKVGYMVRLGPERHIAWLRRAWAAPRVGRMIDAKYYERLRRIGEKADGGEGSNSH
jgi:hypothetical protein